jgi:ribosomal protein S18 acetylase RimI-like enzyme
LAEIWNDSFTGRGAYPLNHASALERWVFSKAYFDHAGLIVALEDQQRVGFALSGFGPNEDFSGLDRRLGIICTLAVRSSHRRQRIGTELLKRSEAYLVSQGATTVLAGPGRPANPFTFGLYGGSHSPGFLMSDPAAGPFLEYHGYRGQTTTLIFQRKLDQPLTISDPRTSALRRRYELQMLQRAPIASWWSECQLGVLEPYEFRLEDKLTGIPAARALVWEMEGFSWRWHLPSAGILDLQVRADLRRQGLGRYLVGQIVRFLQDQYFGVLEVQTNETNQAAVNLFRSLGFEQVDAGRVYRREPRPITPVNDADAAPAVS